MRWFSIIYFVAFDLVHLYGVTIQIKLEKRSSTVKSVY